MTTFTWAYHTVATKHPDSGVRMALGNSYQYASEPVGPDQRVFTLNFKAMKYFTVSGSVSASPTPLINAKALSDFYEVHRLWKSFDYPHPVYGTVVVRFNKPLEIPKGVEGGNGVVEAFSVELIEQPA